MSTMAVVVEILVIGVQAGVGVILWAIGVMGFGVIHKPLSILDVHGGSWRWMPLVGIVFLAACYTLGIFMDRVALFVFHRLIRPFIRVACPAALARWVYDRVRQAAEEESGLIEALHREGGLSSLLADYRSRLRIARATFVNTLLIWSAFWCTPRLAALLPRYPQAERFFEGIGIAFLVVWVVVLAMLQVIYEVRLNQAEKAYGKR